MLTCNSVGTGTTIFIWLSSITASAFFIVWIVVAVTSLRFHAALKKQQDKLFTEVFAWRCWWWPVPAIWLLAVSILLFICCFYSGLYPLVSPQENAVWPTTEICGSIEANRALLAVLGKRRDICRALFSIQHRTCHRCCVHHSTQTDLPQRVSEIGHG